MKSKKEDCKDTAHRYRLQQIYKDGRNIHNYQDTDTKTHGCSRGGHRYSLQRYGRRQK